MAGPPRHWHPTSAPGSTGCSRISTGLKRLKRALDERFGDDARAVTGDLCREIEAVAHDFSRHFTLEYLADGTLVPDTEPPGWPPPDPRDVELRAGSVGEVRRRHDGVGVLALDGLDGVHIAAAYLEAAFALLRGPGVWCWTSGATAVEIRAR
jgi:hypothetical protein